MASVARVAEERRAPVQSLLERRLAEAVGVVGELLEARERERGGEPGACRTAAGGRGRERRHLPGHPAEPPLRRREVDELDEERRLERRREPGQHVRLDLVDRELRIAGVHKRSRFGAVTLPPVPALGDAAAGDAEDERRRPPGRPRAVADDEPVARREPVDGETRRGRTGDPAALLERAPDRASGLRRGELPQAGEVTAAEDRFDERRYDRFRVARSAAHRLTSRGRLLAGLAAAMPSLPAEADVGPDVDDLPVRDADGELELCRCPLAGGVAEPGTGVDADDVAANHRRARPGRSSASRVRLQLDVLERRGELEQGQHPLRVRAGTPLDELGDRRRVQVREELVAEEARHRLGIREPLLRDLEPRDYLHRLQEPQLGADAPPLGGAAVVVEAHRLAAARGHLEPARGNAEERADLRAFEEALDDHHVALGDDEVDDGVQVRECLEVPLERFLEPLQTGRLPREDVVVDVVLDVQLVEVVEVVLAEDLVVARGHGALVAKLTQGVADRGREQVLRVARVVLRLYRDVLRLDLAHLAPSPLVGAAPGPAYIASRGNAPSGIISDWKTSML